MREPHPTSYRREVAGGAGSSWWMAELALVFLVLAAVLFGTAWLSGNLRTTSDNWVGVTVGVAVYLGLVGSFAAQLMAVLAALSDHRWSHLWLPLVTFPTVVAAVGVIESIVSR